MNVDTLPRQASQLKITAQVFRDQTVEGLVEPTGDVNAKCCKIGGTQPESVN